MEPISQSANQPISRSDGEAPLRFAWQTEVSAPKPFRARAFHGESFTLACTPTQYAKPLTGLSGATVALRWQTDGMDPDAWFEAPGAYDPATGELSAAWSPDCDTGADRVRFFLALETPGGASFRAFGTLDLAPTPGFTPPHQTSAKNRSKRRKNPRTDVLAYHPSGDFPTMMRITRTIQPIGRRTCPERNPRKRDSS